jgi:hypothetical protein
MAQTDDILPNLKEPYEFYPIMFIISFFAIVIFILLFKTTGSAEKKGLEATTILYILLPLIAVFVVFMILPNFKNIKQFLYQIKDVSYVLLFTIALIVFFSAAPKQMINDYAYIITPIALFLSVFFIYKGGTTDYISEFNINYERIKSIILLVCLISIFVMFYSVDPGGYISANFGYSLLLIIILSIFSLLYVIVLMTYKDTKSPTDNTNLLSSFTKFSTFGSISLLLFLILFTVGVLKYPGGLTNDPMNAGLVITLFLFVVIGWSIMLVVNAFPETLNTSLSMKSGNFIQRAILTVFGLTISGLLIAFIVYSIQTYTGAYSIPSLLLNLLSVILVLSLIYKTVYVKFPNNAADSKKSAFFGLILSILFYVPCLFIGLFDFIANVVTGNYKSSTDPNHLGTSLTIIALVTLSTLIYKGLRLLFTKINQQGGKQLVSNPVYTNEQHMLASHQQLVGSDNFNYQYGISSWIYIDSAAPNSNASYQKYTSLLNYGGKPNLLYNGKTNTFLIAVTNAHPVPEDADADANDTVNFEKETELIEGVPHRVIYKNASMPLQKWNNIVINYNGGTLDVFLNGELVKSSIEVVPYMTLDTLTIGEKDGINGGICNVVYFNKPLTRTNIYYLYNTVKYLTPPVTNEEGMT